jgi:hypothetical protein
MGNCGTGEDTQEFEEDMYQHVTGFWCYNADLRACDDR